MSKGLEELLKEQNKLFKKLNRNIEKLIIRLDEREDKNDE